MKANRYIAILVLLGSAAWIATGEFASVGSAADTASETPAAETADATSGDEAKTLQTVGVAVIPQIMHARSIKISGVTQADKQTTVTARAGGIIGELLVKQGDRVKEGDVIAKIAPEGRDAALRSAQQALEQAQAQADATNALVKKGTLPKLQGDAAHVGAAGRGKPGGGGAGRDSTSSTVVAPYRRRGIDESCMSKKGASVGGGTRRWRC
jgi:multidrug efflux system membrane fusion protein